MPFATQRMLTERAATLALHAETLDCKVLEDGVMSEHDSQIYLTWSNGLTRTLCELGVGKPPDMPGNRLQQHLTSRSTA